VADGRGWRRNIGLEKYPGVAALLRQAGAELTARSAVALGEAEWLRATNAAGKLVNSRVRSNRPALHSCTSGSQGNPRSASGSRF
jgi:hypothetical protein